MLQKIFKINFILFFLMSFSLAEVIKDVQIFGNKRISKETIIVLGNINLNADYNDDDLNTLLKNIYETNFFKDIKLELNNSTLNIKVIENPIIESVDINGIKSVALKDDLLKKLALQSRKPYVRTTFESDLNLIKNTIKSSGYYFGEIETETLLNEKQNSIGLIYNIDLGKKAVINQIQFIGDKKIKDRKLINIITSDESKFWKFLSQSIYLDYNRIELDKRLLTNYYKNNGYYNARINNSFVEFKNNSSFKLIFNIDAGEKFKFNNLTLDLPADYEPEYFKKINVMLNKLKDKEYSLDKIEKVLREIDKIALSKKYEFIDADMDEIQIKDNKINVILSLKDTQKFYVERINVFGNRHTIEEVIRNSFIVDEGDPYNQILFNKSLNNLKAKNIFGKVETKVLPGSDPNFKIINITVEEKPTGEISLGAGVGTSGGSIGGGIKENNFLGKGIKLDTNIQISENSVKGSFIYEKPNFNYSDNTLFTSVSNTTTDNLKDYGYETTNTGVSIGTAFEQYENMFFSPTLSTSYEKLTTNTLASSNLKKQKGNYFDAYLKYSLIYDKRNKRYRPDSGFKNKFYQELPIVSKNKELVNSFEATKYYKVGSTITSLNFNGRMVNAIGDKDVRISKRLFMAESKLRGFEAGKIGPIDNGDYIGGNYSSSFNLNTKMPELLPSFENIDLSFFVDAGNVWGVDYDSSRNDGSKIRSSTGVSLDVMTPIGPLQFSLSQPITKSSTDKTESFRFNLGTTF